MRKNIVLKQLSIKLARQHPFVFDYMKHESNLWSLQESHLWNLNGRNCNYKRISNRLLSRFPRLRNVMHKAAARCHPDCFIIPRMHIRKFSFYSLSRNHMSWKEWHFNTRQSYCRQSSMKKSKTKHQNFTSKNERR